MPKIQIVHCVCREVIRMFDVFFHNGYVMWSGVQFGLQLVIGMLLTRCSEGLIINPNSVSSSSQNPPIPQYRFHYYVRDDNTGDYKSQEEHRNGDSVTGSYRVGEPDGNLRVVNYVADVANGFKADVNVYPGGSPIKHNTTLGPKKGPDGFGNQRTGISAPLKQRKPTRGFNPIIVKSLSQFAQPQQQILPKSEPGIVSSPSQSSYSNNHDGAIPSRNITTEFTTPIIAQKSVQVELTYQDDSVLERNTEKVILPEKKISQSSSITESTSTIENKNFNLQSLTYLSTEIPTSKIPSTESNTLNPATASSSSNGLYQLDKTVIRSSIMEIVNQQKLDDKYPANAPTYVTESTSMSAATPPATEAAPQTTTEVVRITNQIVSESDAYKKASLPQRPMRLIGLSPIYMDHSQLQTITENLTSPSQQVPPLDHIVNIQYATPTPLVSGPLMGGPAPFRNIPRYVSEFSDMPQQSNLNPSNLPTINSLPISAPIIQQSEPKQESKPVPPPPPASLPLCNDCLLPANYMSYPLLRFPAPAAQTTNNQKPCATENTPYWAPYKPGFAYILMPSQIIKNNL